MAQLLLFLLIAAAAIVALKVALVVATLVFLIIKPKETVSLLFVLGVLALIRNYTVWCVVAGIFIVGFGMYLHRKNA